MLLDFFLFNNLESYLNQYSFEGIEPFTLIVVYSTKDISLNELRWDGQQMTNTQFNSSEAHIWSSVTLYSKEVIERRKSWFAAWLNENPIYTTDRILKFHHFGGSGDVGNDLIMQRKDHKQTVSISCIVRAEEESSFFYKDLLAEKSNCKLYS